MMALLFWSHGMETTTLSSKGQVIIPKALRVARRWGPGTQLEIHDTPDGVLLRPATARQKVALPDGLATFRRRVAYAGPVLSVAEMDAELLSQAALSAPRPAPVARAARKSARWWPRSTPMWWFG
jgi:AbrB family looped-hinge helix DNA binding protein